PIVGLSARELEFFADAKTEFEGAEGVADGLGPRMNLDSCVGCHSQPATGGTSPFVNPQVAFASKDGGTDRVPFFLRLNGPVQQAHFKFKPDGSRDGGVKNTATITGRTGAGGCVLALPDFDAAAATNNLVFRLPANLFGAGLIENIPDRAILANQAANSTIKKHQGIAGRANHNSVDGTISGLAGRPRINPCCSTPASRTPSKWESAMRCFRRSARKNRRASSRPSRTTSPTPKPPRPLAD